MWVEFGARYLLLAGTLDRLPGPELERAIASVQRKDSPRLVTASITVPKGSETVQETREFVFYEHTMYSGDELIPSPDFGRQSELDSEVGTRYQMIAEAMSAFLSNDFELAFTRFNETAHHYLLDEYLPYFALAANATGNAVHLYAALERREPRFQQARFYERANADKVGIRFDEDLTYGVLAAFDGDHEKAINSLQRALNDRPFNELRTVFPYYQIVDLADRLYEQTDEAAYRNLALDLARRHSVTLPMYSWAYFVIAKYSESKVERIEAMASGLHLDPQSRRGSQLSEELRQQAQVYLEGNDPPYLTRSTEDLQFGT